MAIKPLPTDQSAYVGTDGKPATVFYTWLKSLAEVAIAFFNGTDAIAFFNGTGPAWTAFAATIAPSGGSITTYTANGRFTQTGKIVFFSLEIDISVNGTGSGIIIVTFPPALPVPLAANNAVAGYEETSDFVVYGALHNDLTMTTRDFTGAYPGFSGAALVYSGTYEAA